MRLDWFLSANLESALCALGQSCAQVAAHPMSTAAVLTVAFLLLTFSRARLAERQEPLLGVSANSEV